MADYPYRIDDFLLMHSDVAPHVERSPVFLAFIEAFERVQTGGLDLNIDNIRSGCVRGAYTLTVGDDEPRCDGLLQRILTASFTSATWVGIQDGPFAGEPALEEEVLHISFQMPLWTEYWKDAEPRAPGILLRLQRQGQEYVWDVEIMPAWPPYEGSCSPPTPDEQRIQADWDALVQKIQGEYCTQGPIPDAQRRKVWELVESILASWPLD